MLRQEVEKRIFGEVGVGERGGGSKGRSHLCPPVVHASRMLLFKMREFR